MGRKSKKQRALELLEKLNSEQLQALIDSFELGSPDNSYLEVERILDKACPVCGSTNHVKTGKNKLGLTYYKCKDCGRRFNILSDTPLEKTPYKWNIWVTVLEKMLTNQSIETTQQYLIRNGLVPDIDIGTVSAMMQKLRNSFINISWNPKTFLISNRKIFCSTFTTKICCI